MLTSYARPFDKSDPRYRSCCGLVPALYASYVICLFDLLMAIGLVVGVIFGPTGLINAWYTGYLVAAVLACILVVVAIIFTIIGLVSGKAGFLILHLVVRILACLGFILAAVLFGVALMVLDWDPNPFLPDWQRGAQRDRMRRGIRKAFEAQCAAYAVLSIVHFWLFTVLLAAYRYVRDKRPTLLTEY